MSKDSSFVFLNPVNYRLVNGHNYWDIGVTKVERDGKILWHKSFHDSTAQATPRGLCLNNSGDIYIICELGYTVFNMSALLVKMSSSGNILDKKIFFMDPNGLAIGHDGNMFIYGSTLFDSAGNFSTQYVLDSNIVSSNLTLKYHSRVFHDIIVKINSAGDLLWQKIYSPSQGYVTAIQNLTQNKNGELHFTEFPWRKNTIDTKLVYTDSLGSEVNEKVFQSDSAHLGVLQWLDKDSFYGAALLSNDLQLFSFDVFKRNFTEDAWKIRLIKDYKDLPRFSLNTSEDSDLELLIYFVGGKADFYHIQSDGKRFYKLELTDEKTLLNPGFIKLNSNKILFYGLTSSKGTSTNCQSLFMKEISIGYTLR